jgi:hypothetical protein
MVAVGAAEDEPGAVTYHQNDFFGGMTASSFRFGRTVGGKPTQEDVR